MNNIIVSKNNYYNNIHMIEIIIVCYRHPRGQATSAVSVLEGVVPACDIPVSSQHLQHLGQFQVP